MKIKLFLLSLVLVITFSYGQNDCSQGDGTFRYRANLSVENLPSDFDKEDFLSFIVGLDNISTQNLTTLTEHITSVYKTIPSHNPSKSITIVSTIEIDSILADLDNSIEFHYCVVRDCSHSDGTFSYYALLTNGPIANDFDKNDFINYVIELDNISNEDLATITENITNVYKAFPSSQSEFLKRVVVIDATGDIYSILENLDNSIEFHECINDEIVLGIKDRLNFRGSFIYPNPITENSVIKLNMNSDARRLELINSLGQILYREKISGKSIIAIKDLPTVNGISIVKIYDLTNGNIETLKILKEKIIK